MNLRIWLLALVTISLSASATSPDLASFEQLTKNLFQNGQPTAEGVAKLKALGLPLPEPQPADLPNFVQVSPAVYRGGSPTIAGMAALKGFGVKTDIDLQGGDIDFSDSVLNAFMSWWEPGETAANIAIEQNQIQNVLNLTFRNFPLNSVMQVTPAEDVLVDQILNLMGDPAAQPVYIHCQHGVDRTGMLVALYEVKYLGETIADAHRQWANSGHQGTLDLSITGNLDSYYYSKAAEIIAAMAAAGPRPPIQR